MGGQDDDLRIRIKVRIESYLHGRGLEFDEFMNMVRRFFEDSQDNYDRSVYFNAIAKHLGVDILNERDRDELWDKIGSQQRCTRKARNEWKTGQTDPPADVAWRYLLRIGQPWTAKKIRPFLADVAAVRMGISRTLTYIRVFPPVESSAGSQGESVSDELVKCWEMLRRHPYYRNPRSKPRCDINQHAIDSVYRRFRSLCVNVATIGNLRSRIDADKECDSTKVWSFVVFKYATFYNIDSTNRTCENPDKWIWDRSHPYFQMLWRLR